MIRFAVCHCPSCYMRLQYSEVGNFFWCNCDGWSRLRYEDRKRVQKSAKQFDRRSKDKEVLNAQKS